MPRDSSNDDVPTLEMPATMRILALTMAAANETTYALSGTGRTEVYEPPRAADDDMRNAETLPAPPSDATSSGIRPAARWQPSNPALRTAETLPDAGAFVAPAIVRGR